MRCSFDETRQAAKFTQRSESVAMRSTGKVKFYNEEKGYGFIVPDDDSSDLFFHRTELGAVRAVDAGQALSFEVGKSNKGDKRKAINIAVA